MNIFNSWVTNLLLYYVFIILFFQFYKLAVRKTKKDGAATINLQVIAGLSVLLLSVFFDYKFPTKLSTLLLLAAACVFYAINDRMQTTVRKHLQVSTYSVISQLATVFLVFYSITLLRSPFNINKVIGALIIVAVNAWILYQPSAKKFRLDRYTTLAILAAFIFATAISIDVDISKHFNLPVYISLTLLIPALFVLIFDRVRPWQIRDELSRNTKYFFITGLSWALAIFFSLRAFQLGKPSVIVPLGAVAIFLNVVVAYFFLGERSHILKKVIGSLVIILGVILSVK